MTTVALPFANRYEAGVQLGAAVARLHLQRPVLVLGLPRGGIPVAFEVARALRTPLDVLLVRKIGMPGQPELAVGAIGTGDVAVRQPLGGGFAPDEEEFVALAKRERSELERREALYRAGQPPLQLAQRIVVVVDDGLATGATMLAAVRAARKAGAGTLVVAVPVASEEAAGLLRGECNELVVLWIPAFLRAVGEWYLDFSQVEDTEVSRLLAAARRFPWLTPGKTTRTEK
ncbi:MAG TPA: phosphoribosyltransferase family protein [Steroidobacteraceae bacterium]|nr:phosphoribosyltransferase family protein [Steroidobacteraceae bacterium]